MGNALAHAGKSARRVVSAFIATAGAHDSAEATSSARFCGSRTTNGRSSAPLYDAGNYDALSDDPIVGSQPCRSDRSGSHWGTLRPSLQLRHDRGQYPLIHFALVRAARLATRIA
jgi:hypothetical protein